MGTLDKAKAFERYVRVFNAGFKFNEYARKINCSDTKAESELIHLIDSIPIENMFVTIPNGTRIFRARCIDFGNFSNKNGIEIVDDAGKLVTKGFDEGNSRECPLGIGAAGRNNIEGMSYFYAAEDAATACAEVKPVPKQLISLAEFEIQEDLRIVDFSSDCRIPGTLKEKCDMSSAAFMTQVMSCFSVPVIKEADYRVSQIIADHIRKLGVAGIAYRSFYSGKRNYTIFHSHPSVLKYVSSRMLIKQPVETFWDFNSEANIVAENQEAYINKANSQECLRKVQAALR